MGLYSMRMRFEHLLSRVMSPSKIRGLLTEVWRTARWRVLLSITNRSLAGPVLSGAAAAGGLHRGYRQLWQVDHQGAHRRCALTAGSRVTRARATRIGPHHFATTILRLKPNDEFCVLEIGVAYVAR